MGTTNMPSKSKKSKSNNNKMTNNKMTNNKKPTTKSRRQVTLPADFVQELPDTFLREFKKLKFSQQLRLCSLFGKTGEEETDQEEEENKLKKPTMRMKKIPTM